MSERDGVLHSGASLRVVGRSLSGDPAWRHTGTGRVHALHHSSIPSPRNESGSPTFEDYMAAHRQFNSTSYRRFPHRSIIAVNRRRTTAMRVGPLPVRPPPSGAVQPNPGEIGLCPHNKPIANLKIPPPPATRRGPEGPVKHRVFAH